VAAAWVDHVPEVTAVDQGIAAIRVIQEADKAVIRVQATRDLQENQEAEAAAEVQVVVHPDVRKDLLPAAAQEEAEANRNLLILPQIKKNNNLKL
jgi:hypothetical protein